MLDNFYLFYILILDSVKQKWSQTGGLVMFVVYFYLFISKEVNSSHTV